MAAVRRRARAIALSRFTMRPHRSEQYLRRPSGTGLPQLERWQTTGAPPVTLYLLVAGEGEKVHTFSLFFSFFTSIRHRSLGVA
jgi:hypothetical protein